MADANRRPLTAYVNRRTNTLFINSPQGIHRNEGRAKDLRWMEDVQAVINSGEPTPGLASFQPTGFSRGTLFLPGVNHPVYGIREQVARAVIENINTRPVPVLHHPGQPAKQHVNELHPQREAERGREPAPEAAQAPGPPQAPAPRRGGLAGFVSRVAARITGKPAGTRTAVRPDPGPGATRYGPVPHAVLGDSRQSETNAAPAEPSPEAVVAEPRRAPAEQAVIGDPEAPSRSGALSDAERAQAARTASLVSMAVPLPRRTPGASSHEPGRRSVPGRRPVNGLPRRIPGASSHGPRTQAPGPSSSRAA